MCVFMQCLYVAPLFAQNIQTWLTQHIFTHGPMLADSSRRNAAKLNRTDAKCTAYVEMKHQNTNSGWTHSELNILGHSKCWSRTYIRYGARVNVQMAFGRNGAFCDCVSAMFPLHVTVKWCVARFSRSNGLDSLLFCAKIHSVCVCVCSCPAYSCACFPVSDLACNPANLSMFFGHFVCKLWAKSIMAFMA